MNSVIILPEEISSSTEARLSGKRAAYFRERHAVPEGAKVRCGIWNGSTGQATVLKVSDAEVCLKLELINAVKNDPHLELIVSVPRPQTVKKLLSLSAMMGVKRLHYIRTEGTEKSYLSSKSLEAEAIREEIIKGLEQACATTAPEVFIHQRFKPFVEEVLVPALNNTTPSDTIGIIADTTTSCCTGLSSVPIRRSTPVILAIGPESGWNDFERRSFKDLGFRSISLGERQLRVEVAAAVLLGQVQLMRDLTHTSQ